MLFSKEQGTYFKYGRLSRAWTTPGVIVIDEPNTGPPDVWQFLRPLTDNSKQLVLDMNEGEVLSRSDNTYLGMAMNPSWDPKNVGALEIGDADANRLFHVYVTLPPEKVERHIIKSRVALDGWEITDKQLTMVMKIARDIRALIDADALTISWAIRPQIKVARALRWFDPITAYKRAIVDYLEPQAQQLILDAVRANVAH
jgi:MoxR-like ATPase